MVCCKKDCWILLLFAVVLVAVFFLSGCSITGRSSEAFSEDISCAVSTRIDFLRINDDLQACYRENSIYFVVENLGVSELSGIMVFLDADYDVTMTLKKRIPQGESSQHDLNFGSQSLTGVERLRVFPLLGDADDPFVCMNGGVEIPLGLC